MSETAKTIRDITAEMRKLGFQAAAEDHEKISGEALLRRLKGAVETGIGVMLNQCPPPATDKECTARMRLVESHRRLVALAREALGEDGEGEEENVW